MGWWGPDGHQHPFVKYRSDDPTTIARQLDEIQGWGATGVVACWYGSSRQDGPNGITNRATHLLFREAEKRGLKVLLAIDKGAIVYRQNQAVKGHDQFMRELQYIEATFKQSPAIATDSAGQPYLLEFGYETLPDKDKVDWAAALKEYPWYAILHRNLGGFDTPGDGAYTWIDNGLSYLDWTYSKAIDKSQHADFFLSLFAGFDNRKLNPDGTLVQPVQAVWPNTAVKTIDRLNGNTFIETIKKAQKFLSDGGRAAGVLVNTYTDYEEGTAIEGGIGVANVPDQCILKPPFVRL